MIKIIKAKDSGITSISFEEEEDRSDVPYTDDQRLFCDGFVDLWKNAIPEKRVDLLKSARELKPEDGAGFAIMAMQDFSRSVREDARKTLQFLARKVTVNQDLTPVSRGKTIASEAFSQVIFREIIKTAAIDEIREYMALLLEIGGRGPDFAWSFFLHNTISQNVLIDMVRRFPERLRLRFVFPYLMSEVSDRRKYMPAIRVILGELTDVDLSIHFIRRVLLRPTGCLFALLAGTGSLLLEFEQRLGLAETVINDALQSRDTERILNGALFAGSFGKTSRLYPFLDFLRKEWADDLRIGILDVISRSHTEGDGRILGVVNSLLTDESEPVVLKAFMTLNILNCQDIPATAGLLIDKHPSMRFRLYQCLPQLNAEDLIRLLDKVTEHRAVDARRTVARSLLRKSPEKAVILFGHYRSDGDPDTRKAADVFLGEIEKTASLEKNRILRELSPIPVSLSDIDKKTSRNRQEKILKQIREHQGEKAMDIRGAVFIDADLSELSLHYLDLRGTVFVDCNMTSVHMSSCRLSHAVFVNVSMKNANIENTDFDHCRFDRVSGESMHIRDCRFSHAYLSGCEFEFSEIHQCYFTGASICRSCFARSDLSFTSFAGARMGLSDFSHCVVFRTDFEYAHAMLCTFTGTHFAPALVSETTELDLRSEAWEELDIPPLFFEKKLLDSRWLNILILTREMDRQRDVFIRHNERARERALDAFRAEQEDLFELVPLLIHLTQRILPLEMKGADSYLTENILLKNASSGISNYTPTPKAVALLKKYLRVDKLLLLPGKECNIEALFTIGSIGTLAQSSDSDLDYWVCVDRNRMGNDAVELLKLKLDSIERWAKVRFGTDIHFFVVDPESVRKGRFGGSDFESSGSAQGMILKEEFYRTMILVAGKIPFWCVLPPWTDTRHYQLLYNIAYRFEQDYLDLGNVTTIPAGEYFGASMWQLFKSLTSPFKSVMKMALLEKYIHEEKKGLLLCNLLKQRWVSGKYHFRRQDPYVLLFDEVTDFYKKRNKNDIVSLIKLCFFMKFEIRSSKQLDQSVFKIRKLMFDQCVERYSWDEFQVFDLGHFDEWSHEKVLSISREINEFMIDTYKRLSGMLNNTPASETMITSKDLTMLGRKMFVQFSSHPYKVQALPHAARGRNLFKQLYLYYRQAPRDAAVWDVFPMYDKKIMASGNDSAVLKDVKEIEEVAAWVIHNGIYRSGTRFNILPNPSSVSAQDFHGLLKDMNDFFPFGEGDGMPPENFLESFKMSRIFIIVNFTEERKSDGISEFAAVYMTTWGEMFCRKFRGQRGLKTISDALEKVEKDLGLSCREVKTGCHVHKMSRKRIMDS